MRLVSRILSRCLRLSLTIVLILGLFSCSLPQVKAEDRLFLPLSLDFLGEFVLPADLKKGDTPVGGLSGITYDAKNDLFYAISDDRSNQAPARLYTLKLTIDSSPKITQVEIPSVTFLRQEDGQGYAKNTLDPEGIALTPQGTVWVSSEGVARDDIPPFVNEFDRQTGQFLRSLKLPDYYQPLTVQAGDRPGKRQGIQDNLGLESLSLSAGAARQSATEPYRLFTATEAALTQDQPPEPDPTAGESIRMLHYYVQDNRIDRIGEYLYKTEPKPIGAEKFGVAEILSVDPAGRFIALERTVGLQGFDISLFQFTLAGAKDTSVLPSLYPLPQVVKPVRKQLLLDLNTLGMTLDNLEGMTIGPRLADGSQSLLLISDNNFNPKQKTQLLLFRLRGLDPTPAGRRAAA
jgi:hypothetical protein